MTAPLRAGGPCCEQWISIVSRHAHVERLRTLPRHILVDFDYCNKVIPSLSSVVFLLPSAIPTIQTYLPLVVIQLGGLGERCKLPSGVRGGSLAEFSPSNRVPRCQYARRRTLKVREEDNKQHAKFSDELLKHMPFTL